MGALPWVRSERPRHRWPDLSRPPDGVRHAAAVRQALRRAAAHPALVGWALARYRRGHGLSEAALLTWLGLPPASLAALAFCVRPDPASPRFAMEVEWVADATGCHAERLATVLLEATEEREHKV